MIISRTPFRISFFGGGTDYPAWYRENGGTVLSTTINKYCYISCRYLPPFFKHKYLIRYRLNELPNHIDEIQHPSVRESLRFMKIPTGIEMVHTSDLPARSGMGSSSAFTVGFLNALTALQGKMVTKRQLAADAIHVEQEMIREHVGSQDQIAVAFGGFNKIEFGGDHEFYVQPVTISRDKLNALQDHMMLFFTGLSRTASEIAVHHVANMPARKDEYRSMQEMVAEAVRILNGSVNGVREFGRLLDEAWCIKRTLADCVSTHWVDDMYQAALSAGAIGGKLCGAGGGGFLLLFVPPDRQPAVRKKLSKSLYVPFRFESLGSQIILYESRKFM